MKSSTILDSYQEFLRFMKERYKLFHRSNLFFRDLQYGVMLFCAARGIKIRHREAEAITREVCQSFETRGILRRIDHQSWLLTYPEFELPRADKKAA